jgi:hypothetical protein
VGNFATLVDGFFVMLFNWLRPFTFLPLGDDLPRVACFRGLDSKGCLVKMCILDHLPHVPHPLGL